VILYSAPSAPRRRRENQAPCTARLDSTAVACGSAANPAPAAGTSALSPRGARYAPSSDGAPGGCGRRTPLHSCTASAARSPSRHRASPSPTAEPDRIADGGSERRSALRSSAASSPRRATRAARRQSGRAGRHVVERNEMNALVIECIVGCAEDSLKALPLSREASCSPRHEAHSLDLELAHDFLEFRHPLPALDRVVGGMRKIAGEHTKSGWYSRLFTEATAFFSVTLASGFGGPRSPSGSRRAARSKSRPGRQRTHAR